jgi:putative endonuclease
MAAWSVYMVRCGDGSLYTGIASDVKRRFAEHEAGGSRCARYLRGRGPLSLVFKRKLGSHSNAARAEARIKKLPKCRKEALVEGKSRLADLLEGSGFNKE